MKNAGLGILIIACISFSSRTLAQSCNTAYVPVFDSVMVVDVNTGAVIDQIFTESWISSLIISPDGTRAYFTKGLAPATPDSFLTLDLTTNAIINRIVIDPANNPIDMVLSPDGVFAYILSNISNTLSVVNTQTNMIVSTPAVPIGMSEEVRDIAIKPGGDSVYINTGSNIHIFSTVTNAFVSSFSVTSLIEDFFFSPDGTTLYLVNWNTDQLQVYNTADNMLITSITTSDQPYTGAISPDGTRIYVGCITGSVVDIIDATTNTLITSIPTGGNYPWGIDVSPDGARVYVGHFISRTLSIIDASTNTLSSTLTFTNPVYGLGEWFTPACAPGGNGGSQAIPTLTTWGVLILSLLMSIIGLASLRQKESQLEKLQ